MADDPLITELRELGRLVEVPPAPDVRAAVRARLAARPRRRWRVVAAAVAAAVLVAVVPPARGAVAHTVRDLLNFAGVQVEHGEPAPAPHPSPLPSLGVTTLDRARLVTPYHIGVPDRLGPPERVELADPDRDGAPRVVTLVYRGGTIRLDEFQGQLEPVFLKTEPGPDDHWETVNGAVGIWFAKPHAVTYRDRNGEVHRETARLAGPTLVWLGTVTYRLEGVGSLDEALVIASSLR